MMFGLLAIEINRRLELVVRRPNHPADCQGLAFRLCLQNNCLALLKDVVPKLVWKAECRRECPDDRWLPAAIRGEQHRGPMANLQQGAFPPRLAQGLDLQ